MPLKDAVHSLSSHLPTPDVHGLMSVCGLSMHLDRICPNLLLYLVGTTYPFHFKRFETQIVCTVLWRNLFGEIGNKVVTVGLIAKNFACYPRLTVHTTMQMHVKLKFLVKRKEKSTGFRPWKENAIFSAKTAILVSRACQDNHWKNWFSVSVSTMYI